MTVDASALRQTRKYKAWRAAQLRRLGPICGICGHPGAGDLDHIEPVSVNPDRVMDASNVRPAHGITGCPHCPPIQTANGWKRPACNQMRGATDAGERPAPAQAEGDIRGCRTCGGQRCTNGVRVDGTVTRCW